MVPVQILEPKHGTKSYHYETVVVLFFVITAPYTDHRLMSDMQNKTVLITGANSGVGLEAAAQLAEAGWGTVILACRTVEKAEAARAQLVERTGKDPFATLAIDTAEVASARAAAAELHRRGVAIDALVLNAGASGSQARFNSDGVEITWASTLVGHHVLTMGLLEAGDLGPDARIIIAGSEGARGNLPGMPLHDLAGIAKDKFGGDRAQAIVGLSRQQVQESFSNMTDYVTAKLVVAWWAAALARKLPRGMTVNAVSPGAAPGSNFGRDAGFGMAVMMTFMKVVGPLIGMAGSLKAAGRRYVDALDFGRDVTGHFYATEHRKKLVGPMARQTWPEHFLDRASQEAAFEAVVQLTGTPFPLSTAEAAAQ